jgi:hypothetical protein
VPSLFPVLPAIGLVQAAAGLRTSAVEKEVAFQRLVSYDGVVVKEYARMKENRT